MAKRKHPLLMGAASAAAAIILPGLYNGLTVRRYLLRSEKLTDPLRIALITDLHCCRYGQNEERLVEAVHAQKPDLLMMAGDIFDHTLDVNNVAWLLQGLGGRYPCYYVTGNHEYYRDARTLAGNMAVLRRYGVRRLSGELETLSVKGQTVNICGVDDPLASRVETDGGRTATFYQQLAAVKEQSRNGCYTILLSHRPEFLPFYAHYGFDLALCGHAHGGQWRIPGLLNGFFAPNQGLFPKYAGGEYRSGDTTMIVSRGLARETTPVPRFYDPPELVVVDLAGKGKL